MGKPHRLLLQTIRFKHHHQGISLSTPGKVDRLQLPWATLRNMRMKPTLGSGGEWGSLMNRVKKHLKPDLYLGISDCVSQCLSPLPPFLFFKYRHLDYAFCHLKPRVLIDVASFYKRDYVRK